MKTRFAAIADKTLATVPLALLAAKSQNFPSQHLWDVALAHVPYLIPVLLAISAVFALGPFTARAQRGLIERRVKLQRQTLIHHGRLLREANDALQAAQNAAGAGLHSFEFEGVGLHVWKLKRPWWLVGSRRLQRVATYRLGGSDALRQFEPRRGKGVVGICWDKNEPSDCDVSALAVRATTEQLFNEIKRAEGTEAVMGLNWDEFNHVKHRGAVFAAPIQGRGESFRGCVSLDLRDGYPALKNSGMPGKLNELAEMLQAHDFEEM